MARQRVEKELGPTKAAEMFKPPELATREIQYIKDKSHGPTGLAEGGV